MELAYHLNMKNCANNCWKYRSLAVEKTVTPRSEYHFSKNSHQSVKKLHLSSKILLTAKKV